MNNFLKSDQSLGTPSPEMAAQIASLAADVALVVDANDMIVDATASAEDPSAIAQRSWVGRRFADVLSPDTRGKAGAMLAEARAGDKPRWRQLNHPGDSSTGLSATPVDYIALPLGDDGRCLLFGRDLRNIALLQQRLIKSQQALERDYERFRSTESRYRQLFHLSGEPILVVSARDHVILEANTAAHQLLVGEGQDLVRPLEGSRFPQDIGRLAGPEQSLALRRYLSESVTERRPSPITLTLQDDMQGDEAASIAMNAAYISDPDGGHFILRFIPEQAMLPAVLDVPSPGDQLDALVDRMPEAFLVTDEEGFIIFANKSFADMADRDSAESLIGESLATWLIQPGLSFGALSTSLRNSGMIRLMAAKVRGDLGSERDVELSAVRIAGEDSELIGFVVRDIGPNMARSAGLVTTSKDAIQHMVDLVGRMSLKDIVRETTDVIERMCIEAALELANDNRVSAAEILGLSRQSLYVKMRRFGITGPQLENKARD